MHFRPVNSENKMYKSLEKSEINSQIYVKFKFKSTSYRNILLKTITAAKRQYNQYFNV